MNRGLERLLCVIASITAFAIAPSRLSAQKQIDFGAAQAPLSEAERADLDKAVARHNYAAEKAVIDQAIAEHPDSFELLVMTGRLAYLEKHPKDSADAFLRAEKIKPVNDTDRETLALALSFSDRVPEGRAQLQKLMKLDPRNADYPFLLARIDANGNRFEDASAEFAKAIELDPGMVRAYEGLGRAQESLGLAAEARKTYEKGVVSNRANKVRWEWSPLDLGVVLLKAGQLDEADKLFREALQYTPRFAWGHYYMGQVLQKQGRDVDATNEYREAVVDDPRLKEAWLALAQEFMRQDNKTEADKCMAIFNRLEDAEKDLIKGKK